MKNPHSNLSVSCQKTETGSNWAADANPPEADYLGFPLISTGKDYPEAKSRIEFPNRDWCTSVSRNDHLFRRRNLSRRWECFPLSSEERADWQAELRLRRSSHHLMLDVRYFPGSRRGIEDEGWYSHTTSSVFSVSTRIFLVIMVLSLLVVNPA